MKKLVKIFTGNQDKLTRGQVGAYGFKEAGIIRRLDTRD